MEWQIPSHWSLRERLKKSIKLQTGSEVSRPPPPMATSDNFFFHAFFSTLNAVIQYKMQFNIFKHVKKSKGSIVYSRYIGNKVTHFQTTLGSGTYAF